MRCFVIAAALLSLASAFAPSTRLARVPGRVTMMAEADEEPKIEIKRRTPLDMPKSQMTFNQRYTEGEYGKAFEFFWEGGSELYQTDPTGYTQFKTVIGHIIPLVIPAALIIPRVDFSQFQ